ncbi:MAG: hypothetical protein GX078_07910 [Clostridiales bacterium]|nr:hypothetical protein [Clostridiales bacterium]
MDINVNLNELILLLVYVALFVFIVYLIILIKNLIVTLKKTNEVMDDAKTITAISARKATEIDGVVTDVTATISNITETIKGKDGIVKTVSNIGKAVASLQGILNKFNSSEDEEKPKSKKHRKKAN